MAADHSAVIEERERRIGYLYSIEALICGAAAPPCGRLANEAGVALIRPSHRSSWSPSLPR
jgi:hypothetical protein